MKQGAARAMMDKIGDDGLVVDGRKLFFEYRYIHFVCLLHLRLTNASSFMSTSVVICFLLSIRIKLLISTLSCQCLLTFLCSSRV